MDFLSYVWSGKVQAQYMAPGKVDCLVKNASYQYEGECPEEVKLEEGKYQRTVDNSISVITSISKKTREEAQKVWESLYGKALVVGIVTVLVAAGVTLLTAIEVLSAPFIKTFPETRKEN